MNASQTVSEETFIKRMVILCLRSGLTGFPKDEQDQHILLKSAVMTLDRSVVYSEAQVNEKLQAWVNQIAQIDGVDHGTLRRSLIDNGYLIRERDGSSYQVSSSGSQVVSFAEFIELLNPRQVLEDARQEIEDRKRAYLEKANRPLAKVID